MTQILIGFYIFALIISLTIKTPIIKGPWLFLMRSFFPNWKFFHAAGHVPHLYARAADAVSVDGQLQWGEWRWIYPRRNRRWYHIIHNADTNVGLAEQNLVDHFWADLYDLPQGQDPRPLVTYELVTRLVNQKLDETSPQRISQQFELRMELSSRLGMTDSEVMMTSPVMPC
jgi:hypothetical protein